ncbi:hypothetical protein H7J06_19780 [Mycobacterium hodleri]|uniref:hypothetical protein n=1 Tax=Mycolicibacterium hodleri TaxID=49897 RepID=UPI0021F38DB9|nr:hypothetical protein [Mycolicibacterium hodleri]MCV7135223.1 hypothetical protein [Mycolicibacterium hodleri]
MAERTGWAGWAAAPAGWTGWTATPARWAGWTATATGLASGPGTTATAVAAAGASATVGAASASAATMATGRPGHLGPEPERMGILARADLDPAVVDRPELPLEAYFSGSPVIARAITKR